MNICIQISFGIFSFSSFSYLPRKEMQFTMILFNVSRNAKVFDKKIVTVYMCVWVFMTHMVKQKSAVQIRPENFSISLMALFLSPCKSMTVPVAVKWGLISFPTPGNNDSKHVFVAYWQFVLDTFLPEFFFIFFKPNWVFILLSFITVTTHMVCKYVLPFCVPPFHSLDAIFDAQMFLT